MNAKPMIEKVKEVFEYLLYPELGPYGRRDRDRLLTRASETPLDFIEWTGILAALVLVVILTRYDALNFGLTDRIAVAIANFLTAMLLLGVTAGPFLVRRTRRGLHSQLH
jgi:hypothetical protein